MIETAEARGEARGIVEKGKIEEKVAIARNLLQAGVNVELVVQSTGLTIKEIELIKRK